MRSKLRFEFWFEESRVFGADTEHRHRAHVAENGVFDIFFQLSDVLMRDVEREPVFAGFGENRSDGICGNVLKLIDVEIKVIHRLAKHIHARERRHLDLANQD